MKNIAVFYGGVSVEHDVSVITGVLTTNAIDKTKYNPIPVYVDRSGRWFTGERLKDIEFYKAVEEKKLIRVTLKSGENTLYAVKGKKLKPLGVISVAINCMHGERGEDGSLSGLLKMCEIPMASPDTMPSAVCMDKCFTKTVMKGLKVKVLPYATVIKASESKIKCANLGYPLVVKPACLGSSIGVKKVNDDEQLFYAVTDGLRYGEKVIVEPCLTNFTEINCACYKGLDGKLKVSECERPVGNSSLLTFDDKYRKGKRVFPADIPLKQSDKIKEITKTVYQGLCLDGVVRMDFFIKDKDIYLNEVNTVPGSLAYYLFKDTVKGYSEILTELITVAERKYSACCSIKKTLGTGILNMKGAKGKNSCKN